MQGDPNLWPLNSGKADAYMQICSRRVTAFCHAILNSWEKNDLEPYLPFNTCAEINQLIYHNFIPKE